MNQQNRLYNELQESWDDLLAFGGELPPSEYLEQLEFLAEDAESLVFEQERGGIRWSEETLLGAVIKARYAEARLAVKRGYDPRRCAHCGGAHLDSDPDDDFGTSRPIP